MALVEPLHLCEPSFPGLKIWTMIVPTSWLMVRMKWDRICRAHGLACSCQVGLVMGALLSQLLGNSHCFY